MSLQIWILFAVVVGQGIVILWQANKTQILWENVADLNEAVGIKRVLKVKREQDKAAAAAKKIGSAFVLSLLFLAGCRVVAPYSVRHPPPVFPPDQPAIASQGATSQAERAIIGVEDALEDALGAAKAKPRAVGVAARPDGLVFVVFDNGAIWAVDHSSSTRKYYAKRVLLIEDPSFTGAYIWPPAGDVYE